MCFLIVENKFDTLVINNDTFIEDLKMDNKAGTYLEILYHGKGSNVHTRDQWRTCH